MKAALTDTPPRSRFSPDQRSVTRSIGGIKLSESVIFREHCRRMAGWDIHSSISFAVTLRKDEMAMQIESFAGLYTALTLSSRSSVA